MADQEYLMTKIRRAEAGDVPSLLPLIEEYWCFEAISGFESGRVAAQLARLLSDPRLGAGWISSGDGVATGYLIAVYVFSLEHMGVTAEIDEFFVLPSQRGRGIGAELLGVAESEFRRVGCTNVSLQLSRHNDPARAFYRRHQYGERSGYDLLDKMLHDG
ncbi:MAG: GNAT family N-acetyltransferase [Gemmatimonadales bacterium]|nr:GNAT family N-acetyltransferase [Gemmatimonadales bacterium]